MEDESKIPISNKRSPRNRQNQKQEEVATLRIMEINVLKLKNNERLHVVKNHRVSNTSKKENLYQLLYSEH